MTAKTLFEDKLLSGIFRSAYDPIAKRYVRIIKVTNPVANKYKIRAKRVLDPNEYEYSMNELINYSPE